MDAAWFPEVFHEPVRKYDAPEILNTDKGSQFPTDGFTTAMIEEVGVKLSMNGKGRERSTLRSSNDYGAA
ncbi:hypothetical protein CHL67_07810 [Prosthecochloris sp. GSB1]|uniref:hypothetical protein n=1 Tax=Prosthecochloris sp. GSB1 TaxID=281093 RepID=UPI000B8CA485|nr:hypothetical protein [Prosthecochloris sp. GSB1]ASQ90837.1 hypothetical protein CHL67_07810 [Prosthecochloris sp. GSB1]